MLVRKQAIEEVGMMDDGFFMYAEETDWCYRFRCKGWKNRFTPDAKIMHIGGASAPKLSRRRAEITNASFIRYMEKHWSKPRALAGCYLILLFYAIRLAAVLPKWVVGSSKLDAKLFENHWARTKDILARVGRR